MAGFKRTNTRSSGSFAVDAAGAPGFHRLIAQMVGSRWTADGGRLGLRSLVEPKIKETHTGLILDNHQRLLQLKSNFSHPEPTQPGVYQPEKMIF